MLRLGNQPWARDWAGENEPHISMTMMFWPGIGACLLAVGVAFLGDGTWWAGLMMGVMLPVGVVLMLWGGLRVQVPAWFYRHGLVMEFVAVAPRRSGVGGDGS